MLGPTCSIKVKPSRSDKRVEEENSSHIFGLSKKINMIVWHSYEESEGQDAFVLFPFFGKGNQSFYYKPGKFTTHTER